jgi:Zn-dependent peptidase ImmA (M78 family)
VFEDAEEDDVLPFVGSCQMDNRPEVVSEEISSLLDFDREQYRAQRTPEKAFELLRSKVERAGVFVLLIGDLGNYLSAIPVEAFRGFAIADKVAPFIIINDQDAKSAWAFTLLHELAHIFLGETGISNAFVERKIEKFCNQVANDFLVPATDFSALGITDESDMEEAMAVISKVAAELKVSSAMISYRLMLDGCISRRTWETLSNSFRELWLQNKAKDRANRKGGSGPDYYVVRRHRVGDALVQFSDRMMQAGNLTTTKAAKVLGVKPSNVKPLIENQPRKLAGQ